MGTKYSKPSGAIADVKELEYISALLQTERLELRKDGSIQAIDISSFLMSRYGIQVTEEEVKGTVLKEFGQCIRQRDELADEKDENAEQDNYSGTNSSQQMLGKSMEHLDLTQVLALLLIPALLKAKTKLEEYRIKGHNDVESSCMSSFCTAFENSQMASESVLQTPDLESSLREDNIFHGDATHSSLASMLGRSTGPRTKGWAIKQSEKGDAHSPDSGLIEDVLEMMLHDATGNKEPQPLTKDLLKQLLVFYGEVDMADDDDLIEEMIAAASDGESQDVEGKQLMLDKYTFARALTADVELYNVENENRVTTNFYDVYGNNEPQPSEERGSDSIQCANTVWTFPSIDYTADTFRSKSFVILLWVTWIISYFAYMSNPEGIYSYGMIGCDENGGGFWCWMLQGIIKWLILMVQLSVFGTTFVLWASIGNSSNSNPLFAIISMGAIVMFSIAPFFYEFSLEPKENGIIISTVKETRATEQLLYILALLGGFLLLLAELRILVQISIPRGLWERFNTLQKLLIPGTIQLEAKVKLASSFKVNRLIRNANIIHKSSSVEAFNESETTFGRALLSFSKASDQTETIGDSLWVWRKLLKLELFEEEGVWLTTHLLAGNLAQFTICLFIISFFIYTYRAQWIQNLYNYLPDNQKWRLSASLIYGVAWAETATILNAFNYIPSTVRTILQFRSGGIASLHDPKFQKYRLAVDQSTLLFGTIFWGTLYTAILVGVCAMLFLGVCLWPEFSQAVIVLWASFLGFLFTVLLKWLVLMTARRHYYRAFYRTKPALANFVGVVLESWNLGLTTQHMIFRTLRLLFAASFFIGRVDTPLLTPEATFLGPFEIDGYPLIFRKDLLSHEAHRHPYIERLGVMFMMKLRHGKRFGSYPNTCWRLIFTFALLPWMRKYRINADNIDIASFKFAAMRKWTGRMPGSSRVLTWTDNSDSSEEDLKKTNETLRQELSRLQVENDMLRHAVYQPFTHTTPKSRPDRREQLLMSMPNVIG